MKSERAKMYEVGTYVTERDGREPKFTAYTFWYNPDRKKCVVYHVVACSAEAARRIAIEKRRADCGYDKLSPCQDSVQQGPPIANRTFHDFTIRRDPDGYGLCAFCGCRENTIESTRQCVGYPQPMLKPQSYGFTIVRWPLDKESGVDRVCIATHFASTVEKCPHGNTWQCGHWSSRAIPELDCAPDCRMSVFNGRDVAIHRPECRRATAPVIVP